MIKTTDWKFALMLIFAAWTIASPLEASELGGSRLRQLRVEELKPEGANEGAAFLARPVYLSLGADDLYIVDAQDCAVKIFSKTGRFKSALGRKGEGPGELNFPSGVCVLDGRFYVADKLNRRIQVLDGSGRSLGGFRLPFAPDKVLALAADTILVTRNPTGRPGPEKMLHIYDQAGGLVWDGLDAVVSGDPVYDTFRNMILVNAGAGGDFFVNFRSQDRSILHFNRDGRSLSKIGVDERCAFKPMTLPVKGPQKVLFGFCWASAYDGGRFYFLAPEYVQENDLGPGHSVYVLDGAGRLEDVIELPSKVVCIAVAAGRIYALDTEDALRIFRVLQ